MGKPKDDDASGDYESIMAMEGDGADGWTPPEELTKEPPNPWPEEDEEDRKPEPPAEKPAQAPRDKGGRFVAATTADLPGEEQAPTAKQKATPQGPPGEQKTETPPAPPAPDPRLARLEQLESFEAQARGFFQSPIWQQFQQWQQGPRPPPPVAPKPEPPPDDPIERVDWLTQRLLTQEQRHAATEQAVQQWQARAQELERQQGDIQRLHADREIDAAAARIRAKYPQFVDGDVTAIMLEYSRSDDAIRVPDQVAEQYAARQEDFAKRWAAKQGLTRATPPTAPRGAPPQAPDAQEDALAFVRKLASDDSPDGWTRGAHQIMRRLQGGR